MSEGLIEVIREEIGELRPGSIARACEYTTRISAKGKEVLATRLTVPERLDLIREGVRLRVFGSVIPFVKEIPKEFLPELLACGSNEVQQAAKEMLETLNGVVGRTT